MLVLLPPSISMGAGALPCSSGAAACWGDEDASASGLLLLLLLLLLLPALSLSPGLGRRRLEGGPSMFLM